MAIPGIRRHALYLSDQDVVRLERALMAYALVLRIQTVPRSSANEEADHIASVTALAQAHRNCKCPTPIEGDL